VITLGIDVGTTHTKVLALDAETGRELGLAAASTPIVRDAAGEAHRPAQILDTVVELTRTVVAELDAPTSIRS
jgi:sugar (pentulose or hexulose) kinase